MCFVTKWGIRGTGPGQFDVPLGIALNSEENVFVADTNNNRIQKFTKDGTFIRSWGTEGSGSGQFLNPLDVAVDQDGFVFVVDTGNNRIQKFSNTGNFIRSWGTPGAGDGEFSLPIKLDVDQSGNVFVTDHDNLRVQKFSTTGTFITKTAPEQFVIPTGISVDSTGKVYVIDLGQKVIKEFTNNLQFLSMWGQSGTGPGQWHHPGDLDVDIPGLQFSQDVYVVDRIIGRVQVYFWQPDVHPNVIVSENYTHITNDTNTAYSTRNVTAQTGGNSSG